jgi:hypothetical protein
VFTRRVGKGKNKRTIWIAEEVRTLELVYFLEEHIKKGEGMEHFTFGDLDTDAGRRLRFAQAAAATVLLERCGWSQKLAGAVIDAYYAGDKRLWGKPKTMYGVIGKQFTMALAIAKYNLKKEAEQEEADRRVSEEAERAIKAYEIFIPV